MPPRKNPMTQKTTTTTSHLESRGHVAHASQQPGEVSRSVPGLQMGKLRQGGEVTSRKHRGSQELGSALPGPAPRAPAVLAARPLPVVVPPLTAVSSLVVPTLQGNGSCRRCRGGRSGGTPGASRLSSYWRHQLVASEAPATGWGGFERQTLALAGLEVVRRKEMAHASRCCLPEPFSTPPSGCPGPGGLLGAITAKPGGCRPPDSCRASCRGGIEHPPASSGGHGSPRHPKDVTDTELLPRSEKTRNPA